MSVCSHNCIFLWYACLCFSMGAPFRNWRPRLIKASTLRPLSAYVWCPVSKSRQCLNILIKIYLFFSFKYIIYVTHLDGLWKFKEYTYLIASQNISTLSVAAAFLRRGIKFWHGRKEKVIEDGQQIRTCVLVLYQDKIKNTIFDLQSTVKNVFLLCTVNIHGIIKVKSFWREKTFLLHNV